MIEMDNEILLMKYFNERKIPFQAWPVATLPGFTTSFTESWLFLVKVPQLAEGMEFPSLGDHFKISLGASIQVQNVEYTLTQLSTTRIPNPYEDMTSISSQVRNCAAFKVEVPRSWRNEDGLNVELKLMERLRIASSIDDMDRIALDADSRQSITIEWMLTSLTPLAELAALRHFSGEREKKGELPSERSSIAFKTLQNFHGVKKKYTNLHKVFPQLQDPTNPSYRVPELLQQKFQAFNDEQMQAYYGLSKIPNSLYFVNGCPGAGKTEWNLLLAALIQSTVHRNPGGKIPPILFLVDINKTVDDAADRYFKLCKMAGLKLRIIRMYGWPYEMRNSDKIHSTETTTTPKSMERKADFSKAFLSIASLSKHTNLKRNTERAPTLDEAAWEFYEQHKAEESFSSISKAFEKIEKGDVMSMSDWKTFKGRVAILYRAVLAQADFIATTPVASYGRFSSLFRPKVVFLDEAPHARELTTLIPIAYFDPLVWIFTGDVKQTQPFVRGGDKRETKRQGLKPNPFADQLRFSTMARAAAVGALNGQLLVNSRARGNLHRLPSDLFYSGMMKSGHTTPERMYPPSTIHLKGYLEQLAKMEKCLEENRIVVQLRSSCEEMRSTSFWNPVHHKWVIAQVEALLDDGKFLSIIHQGAPGTIIIESPYRHALTQYAAVAKKWPTEWQDRVQVLTVDRAQGNQADVVILDMVRTTTAGFMDNPRRLNVAITRSLQAEIIVMHHAMTYRNWRGRLEKTENLSKLWEDAMADGRVFDL